MLFHHFATEDDKLCNNRHTGLEQQLLFQLQAAATNNQLFHFTMHWTIPHSRKFDGGLNSTNLWLTMLASN